MSTTENDTDSFEQAENDDQVAEGGGDALFGCYSVLSPGVQIVLDGRPVSAPVAE